MATATVTVNGMSVKEYLEIDKAIEIQRFLRDEIRGMRSVSRRHISSAPSAKNVSKPVEVGNGSIRFK
jgi:hypothetical protein